MVWIAILLLSLALPMATAHAQIASYVDERGKRVFVNADAPAKRRPSTSGSTEAGPRRATLAQPGASRKGGAAGQTPRPGLERIVHETAERHRVDPALVRAVIDAESSWNPSALSYKGAQGLMQLIPGTAERFGVANAFDPEQNLDGGVRYLRTLLERYNGDLLKSLAAYNAGEGAVDRAGGVPNYPETRRYVRKITNSYFRPDSGRLPHWWNASRPIYRSTDRGRVVFTNE